VIVIFYQNQWPIMTDVNPFLLVTTIIEYDIVVDTDTIDSDSLNYYIRNTTDEVSEQELNGRVEMSHSATGFFLNSSKGNYYLVTNKHVVAPDTMQSHIVESPTTLIIKRRQIIDGNWTGRIYNHEIDISEEGLGWVGHPKNMNVDVAVVPLDFDVSKYANTIDQGLIKSGADRDEITDYDVGYDSVVIGYPIGFRDTSTEFPIIRKALISSPQDMLFNGEPRFLIDAKIHGGMSGSPVFESFPLRITPGEGVSYSPRNPRLLGVLSDSWYPEEDLQLNSVWNGTLITNIIQSIE
jgi:hypothetical protein